MGLYIENKPMTKSEACAFLGIDEKSIPMQRRKVMQMKTKTIDDKGTKRSVKSLGGKPEFNIYVPKLQREVPVRYAVTQRPVKDSGFAYTPKTLFMLPAEDGSYLVTEETQFLYWYLNPSCKNSPFHQSDMDWKYEYQDKNADATVELEREERIILAMSIIVGPTAWTNIQLKHLAKGMYIGGVDDMSEAVIKQHLKKLAHKDPVAFYNQANSREVLFTGKIQEAIDQNILRLELKLGMQRWYLLGEEILPIQYGMDPVTELKNHMAEKWYLYADKVNNALEKVNIKSMLESPDNDAAFSDQLKIQTRVVRAELTAEQTELLKEIREKDWLEEKMNKIDKYDLNDPNLHPAQRKSYEDNRHFYEAWKAAKLLEEESVLS